MDGFILLWEDDSKYVIAHHMSQIRREQGFIYYLHSELLSVLVCELQ